MKKKVILIADPDRETLKNLGNALHEHGYEVQAARDGSKALEKSILVHPDLVLFDTHCRMIPFKKFVQILRSNPRTEHIPVVIMSGGGPDEGTLRGYREGIIRKPFNIDEVLALVTSTFRKMAAVEEVRAEGHEVQGQISQISLTDLLQIFGINRKTGLLEVKGKTESGRIFVQDGNVVHASLGKHRGEKAFFRMLRWAEGSFAFIPEQLSLDPNLYRGTDILLLDGARQADELKVLRDKLPADNVQLEALPALRERFEGLHPVTQEILDLLEFYKEVGELIEHARVSDFEACRALRTLIDKGLLRVLAVANDTAAPAAQVIHDQPLLDQEALYNLRLCLSFGVTPLRRALRAKLCLLSDDERALKDLLVGLLRLPGMELSGQVEALKRGFGRLGILRLSDNLLLDIMLMPFEPSLRPLWMPLGTGTVAVLLLRGSAEDKLHFSPDVVTHKRNLVVMELQPEYAATRDDTNTITLDPTNPAQVREVMQQVLSKVSANPRHYYE